MFLFAIAISQRSRPNIIPSFTNSYREACQRLQLLENDHHWNQTLNDAVISSKDHQIRTLFSIITSTRFPSKPIIDQILR